LQDYGQHLYVGSPFFKKILVVSTPRVAAWTHKGDRPDPGIGNTTIEAVASDAFFALYTGAVNVSEFAPLPARRSVGPRLAQRVHWVARVKS